MQPVVMASKTPFLRSSARPLSSSFVRAGKTSGTQCDAVRCSTVRPSNSPILDPLSDDRFTGAVIDFLKGPKVEALRTDAWQD